MPRSCQPWIVACASPPVGRRGRLEGYAPILPTMDCCVCIPASLVVEATSWVPGDQTSATEAFGEEPRGWLPPHHPGRTMSHAHPQMQRTGHTGQQGEGEGPGLGEITASLR